MVMQLNLGDHTSSQAGYAAIPPGFRSDAQWARTRARTIARNMPSADAYFRSLPNGRSLTQLLADSSIWVNYSATIVGYGETNAVGGKEIAIGATAFRYGRWTVLATLIHELAHSNGAQGGASKAAEEALVACGLGRRGEQTSGVDDARTPFDPGISG
jgi:hypothetical protein